jgi:integrase
MQQRQRLVAKRDLAILILFLTTGLRRREVLQLKWGDLTFHKGGPLTLRVEVKTGKRRTLRIDDPTPQQALLDYLDATGRRARMKSDSPLWISHDRGSNGRSPKDSVKDTTKERPLTSLAFYKKLKAYGKQINLPSIYTHQTRHTYASWVLQRSKSLHEVKEALGHEHETTTRHYIPAIGEEPDRGSAMFVQRLNLPSVLPSAEDLHIDKDS